MSQNGRKGNLEQKTSNPKKNVGNIYRIGTNGTSRRRIKAIGSQFYVVKNPVGSWF